MAYLVEVTPVDADGEGKGLPVLVDFAAAVEGGAGFTQAAFVADADDTSLATLAAAIDALRDSLITAGLMAAS
jgi:hypothetical protein